MPSWNYAIIHKLNGIYNLILSARRQQGERKVYRDPCPNDHTGRYYYIKDGEKVYTNPCKTDDSKLAKYISNLKHVIWENRALGHTKIFSTIYQNPY
jgi:hypothetical protein